jgi:hypothetical protein
MNEDLSQFEWDEVSVWDDIEDEPPPEYEASFKDFGSCCSCGSTSHAANFLLLEHEAPVPGSGWGCAICKLPANGAIAVLCDTCLKQVNPVLTHVIFGYPADKKRVSYDSVSNTCFKHTMELHEPDEFL